MTNNIQNPDAPQSPGRRCFFDILLTGGIVGVIGAIIFPQARFVIPPGRSETQAGSVTAARVGELTPISGKVFRFGKDPAILILTGTGQYRPDA